MTARPTRLPARHDSTLLSRVQWRGPETVLVAGFVLLFALAVFLLVGLVANSRLDAPGGGDPRTGWVDVRGADGLRKMCDGSTLLYSRGGVVPDAPECRV